MLHYRNNTQSGQTIIEVLIVVAVSSIVFISLLSLNNFSTKTASRSRNQNLATTYSTQAADWIRQLRSSYGWEAIADKFQTDANGNTSVTYCLNALPSTQASFISLKPSTCTDIQIIPTTSYTRHMVVSLFEINNKKLLISINTTWPDNAAANSIIEITIGKTQ
ncbi:MAG: prepilin-type N-terminal cleavage/methylation domain-containing protein [bacterium]